MEFDEWIKENYLPTWYLDRSWLRNKKYFAFLIDNDDSRRIAQFFLDHQPNIDIVYNDLLVYLDVETDDEDGHVLLDYIKDTYPEIWNYKVEETSMELKELTKQFMELQAQVKTLTDELVEMNKPTITLNKGDVVHGSTGEPIGVAVDDSSATLKWNDESWVGTGTFSTALPYIRSDVNYIGGTSSFTQDRLEAEDSKPTNQPSEVVYVLRALPDTELHAELIKLVEEWEYTDSLLGHEISYVFE